MLAFLDTNPLLAVELPAVAGGYALACPSRLPEHLDRLRVRVEDSDGAVASVRLLDVEAVVKAYDDDACSCSWSNAPHDDGRALSPTAARAIPSRFESIGNPPAVSNGGCGRAGASLAQSPTRVGSKPSACPAHALWVS